MPAVNRPPPASFHSARPTQMQRLMRGFQKRQHPVPPNPSAGKPVYLCVVCVTVCCNAPLQGDSPVPRGGGAAARQRAPLARMRSKLHQPPTTPCMYLASPAQCTSHFVLCRCVSVSCERAWLSNIYTRGWADAPRWGERQRRWLAALLPLP
jgi:hypothetical protein